MAHQQNNFEQLEEELDSISSNLKILSLLKLVISFFSPSIIKCWSFQQKGFSGQSAYEHSFMRSILQKMVSENLLEMRISNKGNTLYRIAVS
jgi:hypothetical protein